MSVSHTVEHSQDELARYHRAAFITVAVIFVITVLLMALAVSGLVPPLRNRNPTTAFSLRIVIVLFGLGAVALRRTKFSPVRLRDIAALRGTTGLLTTLQQTTIYVAFIGGAIAVMGFAISLMTGDGVDMLWLGAIAIAVLLYAYPRRAAWERVVQSTQTPGSADATTRGTSG
ncbi:MAG: hypothetical protein WCD76_05955 [Pyrinomonadaceae bacterium]